MSNRTVVESFAHANATNDFDAMDGLIHDDYLLDMPQSGERIRGRANRRAMIENYPGLGGEAPSIGRIIGADDQLLAAPSWPAFTLVNVSGSGDQFQITGTLKYPDQKTWHWIAFLTVKDGQIWRETTYFAEPFEPPAWRARYVEHP
ncbi:MAG TPA: nuclear transport factor 2 family protein [Candidatus Limnocylindrales bacterium]|nr:nuclear transport factor 2 family protein [Candidatus Limnocylindrales bacterium]